MPEFDIFFPKKIFKNNGFKFVFSGDEFFKKNNNTTS